MAMDQGLAGKVAIVCASSRGLGFAIALKLAKEGALVTILSRSEQAIHKAADAIEEQTGHRPLAFAADVLDPQAISHVVEETVRARGAIHILVNNAGGPPAGNFDAFKDEDWEKAHNQNFMSVVRFTRAVLPHMKQAGGGCSITNIVSVSVKEPIAGLILSNTYRAAVVGLAKTLADELAPDGIRVNNTAPGLILTERTEELGKQQSIVQGKPIEEIMANSIRSIPLGRYGTPEEFANVVAFLASDSASYITGVTMQIDGGKVRSIH